MARTMAIAVVAVAAVMFLEQQGLQKASAWAGIVGAFASVASVGLTYSMRRRSREQQDARHVQHNAASGSGEVHAVQHGDMTINDRGDAIPTSRDAQRDRGAEE